MTLSLNGLLTTRGNQFAVANTFLGFEHTLKQLQVLQQPAGVRGRGTDWASTG